MIDEQEFQETISEAKNTGNFKPFFSQLKNYLEIQETSKTIESNLDLIIKDFQDKTSESNEKLQDFLHFSTDFNIRIETALSLTISIQSFIRDYNEMKTVA